MKEGTLFSLLAVLYPLGISPLVTAVSFWMYGNIVCRTLGRDPVPMIDEVHFRGQEVWDNWLALSFTAQLLNLLLFPVLLAVYARFANSWRVVKRLSYIYAGGWIVTVCYLYLDRREIFAWWLD